MRTTTLSYRPDTLGELEERIASMETKGFAVRQIVNIRPEFQRAKSELTGEFIVVYQNPTA